MVFCREEVELNILMLSHTYYGGVYKVGSHHLYDNFLHKGHKVVYISTPLSLFHIIKIFDGSVRERFKILFSNIFLRKNKQIIPLTLFPVSSNLFYSGVLGLFKQKFFFINNAFEIHYDLILIDQPFLGFILESVVSNKIIYRPTDIYEQMISNRELVVLCEKKILDKSDGVIGTSLGVLDFLKNKHTLIFTKKSAIVVENGVDVQHFRVKTELPEEYKKNNRFKVVYVGALDNRFAIEDVLYAAKELPHYHFFLIGNGCLYEEYKNVTVGNVTFLGSRKYENIPSYLQYADCTLLPMKKLSVNESRSPMKYYEYLAVGKPFICSWSRYLVERKNYGVLFYKSDEELVQQLKNIKNVKEKEDINLQEMDWSNKALQVLEFSLKF